MLYNAWCKMWLSAKLLKLSDMTQKVAVRKVSEKWLSAKLIEKWLSAKLIQKLGNSLAIPMLALTLNAEVLAHGTPLTEAAPTADASQQATPRRLADGQLFFPKELQRHFAIRTALVQMADHQLSLRLQARVIADPRAKGVVQSSQLARVVAPAEGMPLPGQAVTEGQILAWLQPVDTAIEQGNQQALLAELDALIRITRDRVQRFTRLASAVPKAELETAQTELKALERRRDHVKQSVNQAMPVLAATSGVISQTRVSAGEIVEPKQVLFELHNPTQLWVEAKAFAVPQGLQPSQQVSAMTLAKQPLVLNYIGHSSAMVQQSLAVWFTVQPELTAQLVTEQPLEVFLPMGEVKTGLAVAKTALLKLDDGQQALWVHTEPELFQLVRVSIAPLDAEHVWVSTGLNAGSRVVTQGAALLAQVR